LCVKRKGGTGLGQRGSGWAGTRGKKRLKLQEDGGKEKKTSLEKKRNRPQQVLQNKKVEKKKTGKPMGGRGKSSSGLGLGGEVLNRSQE